MTTDQEHIRKLAYAVAGELSDRELELIGQSAHKLVDNLRELVGDDAVAARVAEMLSIYCASMLKLPVAYIGTTLDNTGGAYALAAGALAGVYTLPERKQGHDSEPHPGLSQALTGPTADDVEVDFYSNGTSATPYL